jgi:hypothetical protein
MHAASRFGLGLCMTEIWHSGCDDLLRSFDLMTLTTGISLLRAIITILCPTVVEILSSLRTLRCSEIEFEEALWVHRSGR